MKHTVNLADTSFTVELGPETIKVFNSISWQLKRLADAWEGTTKSKPEVKQDEEKDEIDEIDRSSFRIWSDEEIDKAIALYNEGNNIEQIAEHFPGRTANGVYYALLRRGIKVRKTTRKTKYPIGAIPRDRHYTRQNAWTLQEDDKILAWYKAFGPKWKSLANAMPGRTVDAIQSRYHKVLRFRGTDKK